MTAASRTRRRLSVDDFDALIASGRLAGAPVELIDGWLYDLNAQGPVHANHTVWLHRLLERAYGLSYHVRDHSPLRATDFDQPEPDLALVRGPAEKGERPHPTGADVILVELSISTLAEDRDKAAVYARGGVPGYWLVAPQERRVEVHRGPEPDGSYQDEQTYRPGERVPWPELEGAIDAAELLP